MSLYFKSSFNEISDEMDYENLPRYERMVLLKDWQELHHNYRNLEYRLDTMQSDLSQVRLRTTELSSNLQDHVEQCCRVERRLNSLHGELASLSDTVSGLKRQYVDNRATSVLTNQDECRSVTTSQSTRPHQTVVRKKAYSVITSDYRKLNSQSSKGRVDASEMDRLEANHRFDEEVLPDSDKAMGDLGKPYTRPLDPAMNILLSEKPREELPKSDSFTELNDHFFGMNNQHRHDEDMKIVEEPNNGSHLDLESGHIDESNSKLSGGFDITVENSRDQEVIWEGAAHSGMQECFNREEVHDEEMHRTGYLRDDDDISGSVCSADGAVLYHRRDSDSGFVSKVLHESAVLQSCTSTPKTTSRNGETSNDSIESSADTQGRAEPDGAGATSSLAKREALSTYTWQFFQVFDRLVDRRMSRKTRSRYVPDNCSSTESTKESGPSDTDWDIAHGSLIDMKRRSRRAILRRLSMSEAMQADLQTFSATLGHGLGDYFDTSSVTYDDVKNFLSWIQAVGQDEFRQVVQLEDVELSESLREALRVAVATVHATLHPSKDSEDTDRDSSIELHPVH